MTEFDPITTAATAASTKPTPVEFLQEAISMLKNASPMLQMFIDSFLNEKQKEIFRAEVLKHLPEFIIGGIAIGVGLYLLLTDNKIDILFGKKPSSLMRRSSNSSNRMGIIEGEREGEGEGEGDIESKSESEEFNQALLLLILYIVLIAGGAGLIAYRLYTIFILLQQQQQQQ